MDIGGKILKNLRWEMFAQLYSSSCFGNAARAYREAGYRPKSDKVASADSARLIANGSIFKRITHLRLLRMKELAIDATRLMELRLKCAYDADAAWPEKLSAMRDIEKALGLARPDKIEHSMAEGAVIRFVHEHIETPAPQPAIVFVDEPEPEAMPTPAPETLKATEPAPAQPSPAPPARSSRSAEPVVDWAKMSRFGV